MISKGMTKYEAIKFLEGASRYFENRPTGGEDKSYWANVYNAEKCRKIIKILEGERDING